MKNTQYILLLLVSFTFLSCTGQEKNDSQQKRDKLIQIGKTVSALDNQIWVIYQDTKDNYWFGSNGNGVYFYDGKTLTQITKEDGLVDNTIRGIQEDQSGNIYVETPKGISKLDARLNDKVVMGIITTLTVVDSPNDEWKLEPNDMWFSCNANSHDIYRYDGENLYQLHLPKQALNKVLGIDENQTFKKGMNYPYSVYGIDKDKQGNLWIGTLSAGAFRYDGKSFLWFGEKELSVLEDGRVPAVRSIVEDKQGNFWLGNILHKYQVDSDISYQKLLGIQLSKQNVDIKLPYYISATTDNALNLWMVNYNEGVWKYDGENFTQFLLNNEGQNVLLVYVYKDNQGTIWLGTDNAGVYMYDGVEFVKFEVE